MLDQILWSIYPIFPDSSEFLRKVYNINLKSSEFWANSENLIARTGWSLGNWIENINSTTTSTRTLSQSSVRILWLKFCVLITNTCRSTFLLSLCATRTGSIADVSKSSLTESRQKMEIGTGTVFFSMPAAVKTSQNILMKEFTTTSNKVCHI